jgi:hypothetical protein
MNLVLASAGQGFAGFALLAALFVAYLLPLIVAMIRKVPNQGSVAVVNIFLGWTFIGWIVALAMAARSVPGAKREHKSFRIT